MMKKSLFIVSLNSRLGLQHPPIGSKIHNTGVELGGHAIYKVISSNLSSPSRYQQFAFPLPEEVTQSNYLETVFQLYTSTSQQISEEWQTDDILIALGGDHSVSTMSVRSVLKRFNPKTTGIIMFDSHADLNTPKTSPTGNFHGMWLRSFLDKDFSRLAHGEEITIKPNQLAFVGNLELDDAEIEFINQHNIPIYSSTDTTTKHTSTLSRWIQQFDHLHISFDIDIFAEQWVSSTGTPNPNGFTPIEVFSFLEIIRNHPSISLDIVEFNPLKKQHEQALSLIVQVLQHILNDSRLMLDASVEESAPQLASSS